MERDEITLEQLFRDKGFVGSDVYTDYDMLYNQSCTEIHRFPELYSAMRDNDLSFEHADRWGFAKVTYDGVIEFKSVVELLYNCFASNKNIVPYLSDYKNDIILQGRAMYVNETFEVLRNRSLFEIREYLGIQHTGLGADSKMLPSKYSGRFFKLTDA